LFFHEEYIDGDSRQDVLNYLSSFGKFPLLTNNWTESDLNFTKLFNEVKLEYLINMRVNFCAHPLTRDDIICLQSVKQYTWERYKTTSSNFTAKDVQDILRVLSIEFDEVDEMIRGFYQSSLEVNSCQNLNKCFSTYEPQNAVVLQEILET
jgi:hypothetical protein